MDRYSEYINRLPEYNYIKNSNGEVEIIGGGEHKSFGEGDRFYFTSIELVHPDNDNINFYVYVGFIESIMYDQFISSLDININNDIKDSSIDVTNTLYNGTLARLNQIIFLTSVFMFMVILYGVYLVYQIKKINYENENEIK